MPTIEINSVDLVCSVTSQILIFLLRQNRKDAIRYFLQLEDVGHYNPPTRNFPPAGLHGRSNCNESSNSPCPLSSATDTAYPQERRLTRAAFSESLKRRNPGRNSIFDIKGLHKLQETFRILDSSVGKGFVSERHRNDEPEVREGKHTLCQFSAVQHRVVPTKLIQILSFVNWRPLSTLQRVDQYLRLPKQVATPISYLELGIYQ